MILTPLSPVGCPKAIAPPWTLRLERSHERTLFIGNDLRSKGLVDFDQVPIAEGHVRFIEGFGYGKAGSFSCQLISIISMDLMIFRHSRRPN